MSQINQIEVQIAEALNRLRLASMPGLAKGENRDVAALHLRLAELEKEKANLAGELESLRAKRDKDVAALDDLIAQLKPLIEEV
jgi:ABC-type phosphate transport system auxiliary subunit